MNFHIWGRPPNITMVCYTNLQISSCNQSQFMLHVQEDKPWEWNRLFAEVSPDIQGVWDRVSGPVDTYGKEGLSETLSSNASEKSSTA